MDKFLYYAHLSKILWPNPSRNTILKTTEWAGLDKRATDEQKAEAKRRAENK